MAWRLPLASMPLRARKGRRPKRPNFTWDEVRLRKAEEQFLVGSGVLAGIIRHLGDEGHEQLTIEAMSAEALTTSEIEGELLDRASVQSSIRRQFGLATDRRRVKAAEHGIAEMMVSVYRSFAEPLSEEMLFDWHWMVTNGRRDLKDIGRYRRDAEATQVVSGPLHAPRVHFEAPPSTKVHGELAAYLRWYQRTSPNG
jgi:Fic family protein